MRYRISLEEHQYAPSTGAHTWGSSAYTVKATPKAKSESVFTASAASTSAENVVALQDPAQAQRYQEWEWLRAEAQERGAWY